MQTRSVVAAFMLGVLSMPAFSAVSSLASSDADNAKTAPAASEECHRTVRWIPNDQNGCDYQDAHLYNGWGWNPYTGTSCAPRCDYSNADANNGWGWDPYAGVSCPPR